jgi:hypothetical protein
MEMLIVSTGSVRCIYDETLDLAALGRVRIRRGSYVEADVHGDWYADLSPVRGPHLGPFSSRSLALAAERRWLEENWLVGPSGNDTLVLRHDVSWNS